MKNKLIAVLLFSLLLSACGPIWGQIMRASEGVEPAEQISGPVQQVKPGAVVLVYGPFAKTEAAYFICRGEEVFKFAEELSRHGLHGETYFARDNNQGLKAEVMRQTTPDQLHSQLGLERVPDYLLNGTLLRREATVAPFRGVIMDEAYRLELVNLRTQETSIYEFGVRGQAQETVPMVVDEFARRLGLVVK